MTDTPATEDAGVSADLDHEAQDTDAEPERLTPEEMADVDQGDG